MKPLCLLLAFFSILLHPSLKAQETGKQSLTYSQYPSRFDSNNPLKPDSPILLQFSEPVEPDLISRFFQLYDKTNERFAAITASAPTEKEVRALKNDQGKLAPLDTFVIIKPSVELPLGGNWYLNGRKGMKSLEGKHELVESQLKYIGNLAAFVVDKLYTRNEYDEEKAIQIRLNKKELNSTFTPEALSEFVSVSPLPDNFKIELSSYRINLAGDFQFGIDYRVSLKNGLIAYDTTQLNQDFTDTVQFIPNPGFITFPAFTTTQNASGHRRFDVKTGNLTGLRTRVKKLTGDELILAIREYDDHYEGWGENQSLAFANVAGTTIYDQFRGSTSVIDHTETVSLNWSDLTENAQTGAYYLCSEGRSSTREQLEVGAQSLIQLTDIGLVWKQSPEGTTVYSFSLKSGEPLPDTTIRLVDENATPLVEITTNEAAIATFSSALYKDRSNERFFLDASLGKDRHVIRFSEDLNSLGLWSFSIDQRYDELLDGERRTLLFTDRNIYKPGDEVNIKGISRFVDVDKLLGPGQGNARLRIFDARRRKLLDREVTLSETGSFDDSFTLPSAGMGWHTVELDFNPVDVDHPDWRLKKSTSFQVEEYRVNTFEIEFENEPAYITSDDIDVNIQAAYYMGKPLSKAELRWNTYAYSQYPRPRGFDEFGFGDLTVDRENFSTSGKSPLSSKGAASISINLPEQTLNPGPRKVSVSAQVTDANQQTISNSTQFTVHSSDFYLGLRKPDGVHRAGDTATFSIAAVSTEGEAYTPNVPVRVLVEKEVWNTVKVLGANGKMTHRNDRHLQMVSESTIDLATKVDSGTGLTLAQPHQISFPEAGDFLITLTARDEQGRPVVTKSRFTLIGAEEPSWSWYDVIRIDLIPDKTTYEPGDTAKLLVRSPVFGHALLSTERGGVRSTESLVIDQYETVIDIPISQGDAPNVFASVMIIRGSDESPHIHTSADYRLGYCQLDINDPASHLEVTIDSGDAEYYQPAEEVDVSIEVTTDKGIAVPGAEVTFYAVDEGVLSLTGHKTPDPHHLFHATFPLAVMTGQSLGNLLPENPLEQDFVNKGYVIGGGSSKKGLDPDRVRKDFKALAIWEPSLTTDENGIATARFTAPDNLTEFRLMAVVAEGNRFGHKESPLVINKPLIIEPALPVFTNLTDQIDVSAVLHNNTTEAQEIEIVVKLDEHATFISEIGAELTALSDEDPETTQAVKAILNPGATETVSFPIALTKVGEAKWNWSVRSITDQKLRDATESTTQVGYPLPLLRESHSFTLRKEGDFSKALQKVEDRLLSGHGSVEVRVSNSRLIEAADGLDYLLRYPYGCVEQTTSSLIPWLSTQQLRKVLPELDQSEEDVAATIEKGIARLFSMQTGDGGLGYWPGSSQSVLWGSAYGGVAIALAEKQGIKVPAAQAEALWQYLAKNLRNSSELTKAYDLSQRCLASYTLALAGVNETSYHEVLYNKTAQLSGEARALLALAMIESGSGDSTRIETLLSPDKIVPVAEVSWYRQPYIAATRLLAQVKYAPRSDLADTLVDDLMKLRHPRNGWGSTYSNAWPLIALASYSESVEGSLTGNKVLMSFRDSQSTVSLPSEPGSGSAKFDFDGQVGKNHLVVAPESDSPVYVSMTIETRPELIPIEPENRGFSIQRTYGKVEVDGSLTEAENLRVGDLILVTLEMNIPAQRESYLAIDDPLPAIFEAINPNFKSQATQKVNAVQKNRSLYTNYREIRKDRVLFFADSVYNSGDYSLQYLARVVAPGEVTAPPAKIEAMYEPQRFGLSGTERISAKALPLGNQEVAAR
ncbi:MAG: alpha-2-macroglobulin family protein [Verrucomicrobiales bacterium]|nr:alpha-2-macroglobulin family protein [Verrucomicrobiales bacterium]